MWKRGSLGQMVFGATPGPGGLGAGGWGSRGVRYLAENVECDNSANLCQHRKDDEYQEQPEGRAGKNEEYSSLQSLLYADTLPQYVLQDTDFRINPVQ